MAKVLIEALRQRLKAQLLELESVDLAIELMGENNELRVEKIKIEIAIEETCEMISEYKREVVNG